MYLLVRWLLFLGKLQELRPSLPRHVLTVIAVVGRLGVSSCGDDVGAWLIIAGQRSQEAGENKDPLFYGPIFVCSLAVPDSTCVLAAH